LTHLSAGTNLNLPYLLAAHSEHVASLLESVSDAIHPAEAVDNDETLTLIEWAQ
jgi:hypothetical protein